METGMLVLSRHVGEKLMIGDDIVVGIREIKGGQVSLWIEAPKDIPVHREEVYNRIKAGEPKRGND